MLILMNFREEKEQNGMPIKQAEFNNIVKLFRNNLDLDKGEEAEGELSEIKSGVAYIRKLVAPLR
jgi:hypothetical protein